MKLREFWKMGMVCCIAVSAMLMATPVYADASEKDENKIVEDTETIDWEKIAVTDVITLANLRQEPGMHGQILTTLPRGAMAVIEGTEGDWTKVTLEEHQGYVHSELLAFGEDAKAIVEEKKVKEAAIEAVSDSELDLLAAIIQCEAGGESHEGKVAVGAVIMNRMRSSQFPDTISEVVYQSGQFSPVASGILQSTLAQGAREDCYAAARDALNGSNPIGDSLYFNSGYGRGIQIGNQHFF